MQHTKSSLWICPQLQLLLDLLSDPNYAAASAAAINVHMHII